MGNVRVNTII